MMKNIARGHILWLFSDNPTLLLTEMEWRQANISVATKYQRKK